MLKLTGSRSRAITLSRDGICSLERVSIRSLIALWLLVVGWIEIPRLSPTKRESWAMVTRIVVRTVGCSGIDTPSSARACKPFGLEFHNKEVGYVNSGSVSNSGLR